ncbi:MAG: hypothetical protein U5L03_05185 [Burkholderiaceae bacterium]|nr:hypothetical protein [Burkholderiaceae bacterium]
MDGPQVIDLLLQVQLVQVRTPAFMTIPGPIAMIMASSSAGKAEYADEADTLLPRLRESSLEAITLRGDHQYEVTP